MVIAEEKRLKYAESTVKIGMAIKLSRLRKSGVIGYYVFWRNVAKRCRPSRSASHTRAQFGPWKNNRIDDKKTPPNPSCEWLAGPEQRRGRMIGGNCNPPQPRVNSNFPIF